VRALVFLSTLEDLLTTIRATTSPTMINAITHIAAVFMLAIGSSDDEEATSPVMVAVCVLSTLIATVVVLSGDARHVELPNSAGTSVTLEAVVLLSFVVVLVYQIAADIAVDVWSLIKELRAAALWSCAAS
jgi:hypothetical protein